jgi:3-oxoacyl-[acyl-carrier protein] reductase
VAPGIVDTQMNDWLAAPGATDQAAAYSTFNRIGAPAVIADVVAFIASDDARWVTGQSIDATGGSILRVAS